MIGDYVCIGWVDVSWVLVSNIFWGLELGFHSRGVCVYIHSGLYMGCVVGDCHSIVCTFICWVFGLVMLCGSRSVSSILYIWVYVYVSFI